MRAAHDHALGRAHVKGSFWDVLFPVFMLGAIGPKAQFRCAVMALYDFPEGGYGTVCRS